MNYIISQPIIKQRGAVTEKYSFLIGEQPGVFEPGLLLYDYFLFKYGMKYF